MICLLPENEARRLPVLAAMVARTKAQALLFVQQQGFIVTAIFETPAETITWRYCVEDRIDRKMLVRQGMQHNADMTGILRRSPIEA